MRILDKHPSAGFGDGRCLAPVPNRLLIHGAVNLQDADEQRSTLADAGQSAVNVGERRNAGP